MQYDYNKFVSDPITLIVFDKEYEIRFIPDLIEEEILINSKEINEQLLDITKLDKEIVKNWRTMINDILKHERNGNKIKGNPTDDMGFVEIVTTMNVLMYYITKRFSALTDVLGIKVDNTEKKTEKAN